MGPESVPRIFVLSNDVLEIRRALQALERGGFTTVIVAPTLDAIGMLASEAPDALVIDMAAPWPDDEPRSLLHDRVPEGCRTLALLPEARLRELPTLAVDDFVLHPPNGEEVCARLVRLLALPTEDTANVIRCNDLVIDIANYTVTLASRPIDLTYKEYELLRFLATNPDRVFTREALLNRVWGYDYYGGSRTVDVHVRRLRSKIEGRTHTFIETVRNVGYRFRTR